MAGILADQVAQGVAPQGQAVTEQEAGAATVAVEEATGQQVPEGEEVPGQPGLQEPTPEEQDAFSRVELAAKTIIHKDPESFKKIAGMLESGADTPVETLAQVASMVFGIVDEKSGGKIPEDVILRGAEVTLDLVIKVADDTGAIEVDEETANRALEQMIGMLAEKYGFEAEGMPENTEGLPPELVAQLGQLSGGQQNVVTG